MGCEWAIPLAYENLDMPRQVRYKSYKTSRPCPLENLDMPRQVRYKSYKTSILR